MNLEKKILLSSEKEKLADIIIDLLGRLDEFEKNEFISKNIGTQLVLDNMGEGDGFEYLKDVEKFYKDCLKGEYIEDNSLVKTVCINIVNFKCLTTKNFHAAYRFKEINTNEELTDIQEIHFIEIPKLDDNSYEKDMLVA